jgi:hypothetical protein
MGVIGPRGRHPEDVPLPPKLSLVATQRHDLADALVRKADVGDQYAVGQPRERLVRRIGVDRRQALEVARVQCLEQVERLGTAYLPDQGPVGEVRRSTTASYCFSSRMGRALS